ncbi:Trypanosome variant surface glycoprotein (A-type), putative [Trypanosoma equiperdum]|uniref:Trypanosome variant surface glycoprotein (A-type), putative n=1 Tax=Trypanosoma equiperdum TaxID=5694 RepID=A0A1G4IB02_TRYEQ|nr:Trypanosome variant surface glycoprotein (A-type), putative [Trypanosoma equiperdum]
MAYSRALASTAILLAITWPTKADYEALKANVWHPHFELVQALRAVPTKAAADIKTKVSNIKTAWQHKATLQVAAALTTNDEDRIRAAALAQTAEAYIAAQLTSLNEQTDDSLQAAAAAGEGAGTITGSTKLLLTTSTNTKYCLGDANTGNSEADVDSKGCSDPDYTKPTQAAKLTGEIIGPTGFPKLKAVASTTGRGATAKCGFFKHQATTNSGPGLDIITNPQTKFLYGLLTPHGDTDVGRTDKSNINPTGEGTATVWQRIHSQALSILKLKTTALASDRLAALKTLAKHPAAATEIKRQIAIQQNKKSVSDITESADELRKRYFGADNEKLPAFLEDINNLKAPIGVDQSDPDATLKAIDTAAAAEQVVEFSIYQLKQNLKQATAIVKQQATSIKESETDETCEKKAKITAKMGAKKLLKATKIKNA